jgi:hypothetical protein
VSPRDRHFRRDVARKRPQLVDVGLPGEHIGRPALQFPQSQPAQLVVGEVSMRASNRHSRSSGQAPKNVLSNLGVSESMLENRQAEHLLLEPIQGASGLDGFERLNLSTGSDALLRDSRFTGHRALFL